MRSLLGSLVNRAPVPYSAMRGNWWGGPGRKFGTTGQLDAMAASAALFAIVNRTSTAVAKETWHLHRVAPGMICEYQAPGDHDVCGAVGVEWVQRHPAQVVLDRPSGFYTAQELFESGQQHVDLTGEGWLVVGRIGTMPAELWIARPDRMIVVTDPEEFLIGYIYLGPDGTETPLRREDVLSLRMPNPIDPYRGLGPVQSVMQQVAGSQFSAEWNTNFFRNGARPGGIVKLSRNMDDREFDQLVERFNLNHRGVANANRTAFLDEGDWIDVQPMSLRDMQFVEVSNLNRDTILLAYGMNKFAVGVVDDVNRATAEASKTWFGETQTVPRLDRWLGMLNNDYLPLFPPMRPGDDRPGVLSFVYSNPVPADRETARDDKTAAIMQYNVLVRSGVDPVDAAKVCGLPEMNIVSAPLGAHATVIPADG